jgi:hypothetical protein
MRTTKAKIAAGLMLAVVLAAGAGMFTHRTPAADPERVKVQATAPAETRREPTPREPRVRFLSLAEARAIALEQGSVGQPSLLFPGIDLDHLVVAPEGAPSSGSNSIRVLADVRPRAEGIILAGIAKGQDRAELERNVNQTLLNIETAYWNLCRSYWNLYSREQGLRLAYESWKIVGAKYKVGRVRLVDYAQAEGQYNLFRSQCLQANDTLLDDERQLRNLLGMQTEDGKRLVPSDAPSLVEKKPDWEKALAETMKNSPQLRLARRDIARAKNGKEDSPENRQAKLQLARAYMALQDQELKAERFLGLEYRRMSSSYFQIKAARAQRLSFAEQLRKRFDGYRDGKKDATLDVVLEAQRFWADALATECNAIVTYNNAICGWEYVKGSILDYAHVTLAEKPPADGEQVRAVEHERKQTRKKVRREDAKSVDPYLPDSTADEDSAREMPAVAPSLPSLWKARAPLLEVEQLPSAEQLKDTELSPARRTQPK